MLFMYILLCCYLFLCHVSCQFIIGVYIYVASLQYYVYGLLFGLCVAVSFSLYFTTCMSLGVLLFFMFIGYDVFDVCSLSAYGRWVQWCRFHAISLFMCYCLLCVCCAALFRIMLYGVCAVSVFCCVMIRCCVLAYLLYVEFPFTIGVHLYVASMLYHCYGLVCFLVVAMSC